jgi:hypothetical protein
VSVEDQLAESIAMTISSQKDGLGISYAKAEEIGRAVAPRVRAMLVEAASLQLTDDHELCETQISELTAALSDVVRAKSFDMLPRTVQDRVKRAIKTRGITLRRWVKAR